MSPTNTNKVSPPPSAVKTQNAAINAAAGVKPPPATKTPRAAAQAAMIGEAMAGKKKAPASKKAPKKDGTAKKPTGKPKTAATTTPGTKGRKAAASAKKPSSAPEPAASRDHRIQMYEFSGAAEPPASPKASKKTKKDAVGGKMHFEGAQIKKVVEGLGNQNNLNAGLQQNTQTQVDHLSTKVGNLEKVLGAMRGEVSKLETEKVDETNLLELVVGTAAGAIKPAINGLSEVMTTNFKKVYETIDATADITQKASDSAKKAAKSAEVAEAARMGARNAATATALDMQSCKKYAETASKAEISAERAKRCADIADEAAEEAGNARDEAKQHSETGKQMWDEATTKYNQAADVLRAIEKHHKDAIDLNSKTVSAEATVLKLEQLKPNVDALEKCQPIVEALQDIASDPVQVANNLKLVGQYMPCLQQLQELGSPEVVSGLIETIKGTDLSQLSATVKCLSSGPEACRRKRLADEMQEKQALNNQIGRACQSMISMGDSFGRLVGKLEDCFELPTNKRQRTDKPSSSDNMYYA